VALNTELDDELRSEGLAREVVHAVQAARKNAGLDVEDRIALGLAGDAELLAAARAHEDYLAGETLASTVAFDGSEGDTEGAQSAEIEGRRLSISVSLAP
jgi:isoleucyl-tRNA synthetase